MPPFFSKKQKAWMRQRRKRKRDAIVTSTTNGHADDATALAKDSSNNNESKLPRMDENGRTKRQKNQLKEEEPKTLESINDIKCQCNGAAPEMDNKSSNNISFDYKIKPNGKIFVTVPSSLSEKESKKFRKDARRFLRSEGKIGESSSDDNIEFVSSHAPISDKPKKSFPSIRDLLVEKRDLEKAKADEDELKKKREKEQSVIPESVKARYIAMDCEMVGIGLEGKLSALARVSLVDWHLNTLLDTFVQVPTRVTDFRTFVSGVTPKHIKSNKAMDVKKCRELVASLLKGKILVGHALINDLKALMLNHPKHEIRDTAKYRPFQRYGNGKWRPRKLRDLVKENLKGKEDFQAASHDSVDDAKASMELFQVVYAQWEKELEAKTKKISKK